MPKRVGSSDVNISSSIDRRGRRPDACSARIASSAPSTPTVPSYMPALGMASMCEPVQTAGSDGSSPAHRAKRLPTASSRSERPAAVHRLLTYARAARSGSVKTTRVTAGAGAAEKVGKHLQFVRQARGVDLERHEAARFQSL